MLIYVSIYFQVWGADKKLDFSMTLHQECYREIPKKMDYQSLI